MKVELVWWRPPDKSKTEERNHEEESPLLRLTVSEWEEVSLGDEYQLTKNISLKLPTELKGNRFEAHIQLSQSNPTWASSSVEEIESAAIGAAWRCGSWELERPCLVRQFAQRGFCWRWSPTWGRKPGIIKRRLERDITLDHDGQRTHPMDGLPEWEHWPRKPATMILGIKHARGLAI